MSETLHALRVKGVASPEALALATGLEADAVLAELRELEAAGLVIERPSKRRPGWVLTEPGRAHHAEWLAASRDRDVVAELAGPYSRFLSVNGEVKAVSARWQAAASDAERVDLVESVEGLHRRAEPAFEGAAALIGRFGRYRDRLETALAMLDEDPSYFVSPRVDSYHTVWFECHEDFLLTLGRTRSEEGSE